MAEQWQTSARLAAALQNEGWDPPIKVNGDEGHIEVWAAWTSGKNPKTNVTVTAHIDPDGAATKVEVLRDGKRQVRHHRVEPTRASSERFRRRVLALAARIE